MLLALTVNGYLPDPLIIPGGVSSEVFLWFVSNRVLPHMLLGDILIMDNASIHHDVRLLGIAEAAGVRIEYLPPYSPDLNPIKQTFNVLKAWIRRHITEAERFETFGAFLRHAIYEAIGSDCRSHFIASGYLENRVEVI